MVNATSTEPIDLVNATSTAVIQPLVELQVIPVLTSTKETYLISEDAVLDLEFYNEYDVLMNELTELDNALQLLTIDVNQTLQETIIELDSASVNQVSPNPVLNFINILFFIPEADAANLNDEDALKIEIENTKSEIKKLKAQLKALKEDPNPTEEEIKAAKEQLKKVIQQIKSTASQVSKTELKDEGAKLDKSADDIEKIGGVEPEALIQTDSWIGIDETIVGEVYDSEGIKTALKVNYEKIRDGKFTIKIEFDKDSKPGLYKLKTTLTVNGQTFVSESEFAWGLVSLNTVKSIYNPGEIADFVIVVLDNGGHPVCDANLTMGITAPDSKITMLSSGNGITTNAECGLYDTQYTTTVEGTYLVDINAQTQGINTNFSTTFDVSSFFEFDIVRTAQSMIDPTSNPNSFDVRIDIESFVGGQSVVIKESIPVVFDVVTDGTVQIVGDTKVITWNKSLVGDKTFVEYSYSIPLVFPQLYALGPIEINYGQSLFTEARPWFVAADPAWFDSSWVNRKKITIDKDKVDADLTGFPILFSVTDTDLKVARSDGFDFVITKADGTTEVPYEREKWDGDTGELILWFKGDILDLTDVDFYIYYNKPTSTDKADPTNVWDSNYKNVWHMDGTGSTITDSTSNNNDKSLPSSWAWDSAGEISAGLAFTAQQKGGGDQISLGINEGNDFTIEFWIEGDAAPTSDGFGDTFIIRGSIWNGLGVGNFGNAPSAKIDFTSYGGCCRGPFSTDFGASQADFYTLTLIHDTPSAGTATLKVYKNGAIQQTEELTQKTSGSIRLGSSSSSHYQLGVSIDEFRASKTVRTAGWISTEYNNQNDPDAFVSFGLEELV